MTVRGRTEWQKLVDQKLSDHEKRLSEHEKEQAVYKALQEEQREHLNNRFNRVQDNVNATRKELGDDIKSIKDISSRVFYAVVIAVALAIVNFILKGGLTSL